MESVALKSIINVQSLSAPPKMASELKIISSPCAGCKFLRRKCQPDCVFAPYFPPDQPQKFVNVHRVFGASNVTKILNELNQFDRDDAVNSLAYEAEMRLRDPVYGCVGIISLLQRKLRQVQLDLGRARSELEKYQLAAEGIQMEQQQQGMMMMRGYPASADQFGGMRAYDAGLMLGMGGSFAKASAIGGDDRH